MTQEEPRTATDFHKSFIASVSWDFRDIYRRNGLLNNGDGDEHISNVEFRRVYDLCNETVFLYRLFQIKERYGRGLLLRWRKALFDAWAQPDAERLLEKRFLYQPVGRESGSFISPLVDMHSFIQNHLKFCDGIEDRLRNMTPVEVKSVPTQFKEHNFEVSRQTIKLFGTARSVILLFDPICAPPPSYNDPTALVLTGDNSRMKSGPVTFDTIRNKIISYHEGDQRVAYIARDDAVEFLCQLEEQEIQADPDFQIRNAVCRAQYEQTFEKRAADSLCGDQSLIRCVPGDMSPS